MHEKAIKIIIPVLLVVVLAVVILLIKIAAPAHASSDIPDQASDQLDLTDFVKSYYETDVKADSMNVAMQHFLQYAPYLTENCREQLQPNDLTDISGVDAPFGANYQVRVSALKQYFTQVSEERCSALLITKISTTYDDVKTTANMLLSLSLVKVADGWLVDDIRFNTTLGLADSVLY